MPIYAQLEGLYRVSYFLTYVMFKPIHVVCIDDRTNNLFILAGENEEIEIEITPEGEVI